LEKLESSDLFRTQDYANTGLFKHDSMHPFEQEYEHPIINLHNLVDIED